MNIARNQHALSDRWPVVTPVRLCPDGKVVLEIFVETRIGEEDLQELVAPGQDRVGGGS